MKIKNWLPLLALAVAIASVLAGCGFLGTSYLALDFSFVEPTTALFPALPDPFFWATYYEHPEGTYYGEYTNFDFYDFTYTISSNREFFPGSLGDDRYYTMLLDLGGPDLYYYDAAASLAGKGSQAVAHEGSMSNAPVDRSLYDLGHPEPFSYERSANGVTIRFSGNRYNLK
jgi:hypothetical protein